VTDFAAMDRFGLMLVRPGMLVLVAPPLGGTWSPALFKMGATVLVAVLLMPVVALPAAGGPLGLTTVVARELVIGLALGMGLRAVVAGAEFAGQLAGFQIGFSYASLVDPATGARNNILSSTYGMLAVFVILLTNAHHDVLRALALSYDVLPVGIGAVQGPLADLVGRMLGLVFLLAVQLAAPVVVVLLIVEVSLGLLARAAPMLNLMVQGFPLRVLFGLLALAATIQTVPGVIGRALPRALDLAAEIASVFR
jgi:flagellar biosynthesis protein FliR